jgi:hypothetical protein
LVSAAHRDKKYKGGVFLLNETRGEIELRRLVGWWKKRQELVARFHIEPTAHVVVEGPLLVVSELSVTLESPSIAADIAELIKRPTREREHEALRVLAESESAVSQFLELRDQTMAFLSKLKTDPREALLAAESLWPAGDANPPLDAVYSSYSSRLAVALEKMSSSLTEGEKQLGPRVTERLYAIAYVIGAVQDSLLAGERDLAEELAALQELGISTTAQELQTESSVVGLVLRAHPVLAGIATSPR